MSTRAYLRRGQAVRVPEPPKRDREGLLYWLSVAGLVVAFAVLVWLIVGGAR